MKTLSTYSDVLTIAGQQVTAQQLLNQRLYIEGEGWGEVCLSPSFRKQVITDVCNVLGGHLKTRARIESNLTYRKPQHWGLERIMLYGRGTKACLSYCAGQDYYYELKQIRRALS